MAPWATDSMIELRWLRHLPDGQDVGQVLGRPKKGATAYKMTLQYRDVQSEHAPPDVGWQDIPMVDQDV